MKKALSILLIVAAVFGFYGGAVNLKDVLACKDYWEVEGEKSTENLNKLEDGINQLKENEQAYLDGLDKVAQGEQDLAKGEADYAAAPAKLAAGYAKYNDGLQSLADGKKSLKSLQKLIDGLNGIYDGYTNTWKPGYEKLKAGRETQLTPGIALNSKNIKQLTGLLLDKETAGNVSSAVDEIANDYSKNELSYSDYNKDLAVIGPAMAEAKTKFNVTKSIVDKLATGLDTSPLDTIKKNAEVIKQLLIENGYPQYCDYPINIKNDEVPQDQIQMTVGIIKAVVTGIKSQLDNFEPLVNGADVAALIAGINNPVNDKTQPGFNASYAALEEGRLSTSTEKDENGLSDGIQAALSGMLGNEDMKKELKKYASKIGGMAVIENLASDNSILKTCDFPQFESMMDQIVPLIKSTILPKLRQTRADGNKAVRAGEKELAAGKKELAKGYADYKAAPGKLVAGRAQLADGKAQLAQYEDGEQQVRDGLATLFATEANGGLESIASRLNNDDNFDNEDGHLMLDRGLTGVQEGRNYSDDSSVVITKELTTRAIGTGAGLGAALLALIGAILCFAKKYKGAGVFAALTAICGVAGIAVAKSAGTEFSGIAGSPLSATPYIAFAVLAGLGVIAAIANFAAKKA
ncbi:MAG: hypothetical protein KBS63_04470 [Clostridiales bacterium]|nr:hypothetical protein [Candidatus Crickella caballi]